MRIAAASAGRKRLPQLLDQVLSSVKYDFQESPPDLGLLFLTNHFEDDAEQAARQVREATGVRCLLGCTAESIIGPEQEHEQEPAVSVWLAALPGTSVTGYHVTHEALTAAESPADCRELLHGGDSPGPHIVLADPFTMPYDALLDAFNQHLPGCFVIGGMASGADAPEQSALILDGVVHRSGAVAVALRGGTQVDTVVSQGCRPIGRPYVITRSEQNVIYQLGGRKPLELLNQIFEQAPTSEQELMQQGIFLGRVINEQQDSFHRGDFLIRNLIGADQESGAIAVGDFVRTGSTVQFHVRDAATADEDLRTLLRKHHEPRPGGALLFSCNGRGTRLFDDKNHDVGVVRQALGPIPIAGFFCAGEFGPVGGKSFIHGHTASLGLFRKG